MIIEPDVIEQLAKRWPSTRFVTVNHSSQSDLARLDKWLPAQNRHAALALSHSNVYYAVVDERNPLGELLGRKFVCVPNAVRVPDVSSYRAPHDVPVVSLICQPRLLKNLPNQIVGLALAARHQPLRVRLSMGARVPDGLLGLTELTGLDVECVPWSDWSTYMRLLADRVDVGLQVSFTESFNYVALEHMLQHVPVIGSGAIRYLPSAWQSEPDDPHEIADRLLHMLAVHETAARQAEQIAREYASRCNNRLVAAITSLLNS